MVRNLINAVYMKQLLSVFVFAANFLYSQSCFTPHQAADLMISGVDFNNTGGALRFNHPNGLATNGTNLLMCDRFNNRVLVWYMAPTAWHTPPDLVLGQPDFLANNPGTSKSEMNWRFLCKVHKGCGWKVRLRTPRLLGNRYHQATRSIPCGASL